MQKATVDGENLIVRRAEDGDLEVVLDVLTEAASAQAAIQGTRREAVWPVPFPSATVEASLDRGETYVLCRNHVVLGTVALCWTDAIWGEQIPDSGYVHRLAVRRHSSGEALGALMLRWATQQVADAGRDWLRLDCPASNRGLRKYYEHLGFEFLRVVEVTNPPEFGASVSWRLALFQRTVNATSS